MAAVVLHTWLAHHGVSRAERYDLELDLQHATSNKTESRKTVPLSIAAALNQATASELLRLCQRAHTASLNDPITAAIGARCKQLLLDKTARSTWCREHSMACLDGSSSTQDLLRRRHEHFAQIGAASLPAWDDILALLGDFEVLVQNALIDGNKTVLTTIVEALDQAFFRSSEFDEWRTDMATDLLCLMFFTVLRREAFDDVYLEVTDRCPYLLPQPDQAAVFAEIWVLGSQCEAYFGVTPLELGRAIYDRYQAHLSCYPPHTTDDQIGPRLGLMTMYPDITATKINAEAGATTVPQGSYGSRHNKTIPSRKSVSLQKKHVFDFGVVTSLHLPAILDTALMSLWDRGIFTSGIVNPEYMAVIGYAVFISFLVSAAVAGYAARTAHFYMLDCAYENIIYSHVQSFSGGCAVALAVAAAGIAFFTVSQSLATGLVFAGYIVALSAALSLAGIMATMHQTGSPLPSGRKVLWRTAQVLLAAPILSVYFDGHDLLIYLSTSYVFLFLLLAQYRRLCREWTAWLPRILEFSKEDIDLWYSSRIVKSAESSGLIGTDVAADEDLSRTASASAAERLFREEVDAWTHGSNRRPSGDKSNDPRSLVERVGNAMPYIEWLLAPKFPRVDAPLIFSAAWFRELDHVLQTPRQVRNCLKEHNAVVLLRLANHDIISNVAFVFMALMYRWTALFMQGRFPHVDAGSDLPSRLSLCFSLLYCGASVVTLDEELQESWFCQNENSLEKLTGLELAKEASKELFKRKRQTYSKSLTRIVLRMACTFVCLITILHITTGDRGSLYEFACYSFGYTNAAIFLFNAGFTKNMSNCTLLVPVLAIFGLFIGLLQRKIPREEVYVETDVIMFNITVVTAAVSTSILME
ncbi:uncharacterized protein ColSpa_12833 [Colletotrichum spaethianum]|uniref:DUF3492 domain-containing protein n=1 Tax=Colletotrichum spaethianum TaxID=700344 RepID=A0AA37USK9_9PEZI|nr:uncharacterized protein ColSpa_12833 [Colletotrichum spaethianum]GKT52652.1 hypothetical protein ColSpa_12833 [Colletotrichum spaethianum]